MRTCGVLLGCTKRFLHCWRLHSTNAFPKFNFRQQHQPYVISEPRVACYSSKASTSDVAGKVLAIRREDQSVWERRAPLAPDHVRKLVKNGVKVLVQPSNRRAYTMQAYANAGARIQEDISEASVIIGVKQVPIDSLIPNKTYVFFSHTIKAQEANMPLLDAILEKNIRLIDYERMVNEQGQRVVAFGIYAGVAGMVNILHGLGLRLLALGHHTPFMHIGPAHNYRTTEMAKAAVRDAGYEIALGNLPKSLGVMTFVFTGSGNVSQGAQEVFRELPFEMVSAEVLPKVCNQGKRTKVYGCEVSRPDHYKRKNGGRFDAAEFDEHPERYYSSFSKNVAPYTSVLVNGIYWAPNSPRLLTIPDAKKLSEPVVAPWLSASPGAPTLPHRMVAICDISADPGGSIEFMTDCTTIDNPFCIYDPALHTTYFDSFKGAGFLVCSIDNMPTQLPREATDFFGELLLPHMYSILQSDAKKPLSENPLSPEVDSAVIASNGELTPKFAYISELRQTSRSRHKVSLAAGEARHKCLILGAGYVSGPLVEYLTRDSSVQVTVASALKDEADNLADKYPNTKPILLDVQATTETLNAIVKEADVVVSLLPYHLHPIVAECCIENRRNMVTASYLSPAMQELNERAVDAGITIVNEVGLDPGIDHLLALEYIDYAHVNGGKIESFVSYCGGLPAPENSENPLRYKFSWSPRGVLLNALNNAKYVLEGKVIDVPAGTLMNHTEPVRFLPGFALEGYPNRDSTVYKELYGIPEAKTVLRGSLRYVGYAETMQALVKLGMIDPNSHPAFHPKGPELSWRKFVCAQLGKNEDTFYDNIKRDLMDLVGSASAVEAIEQLGLLSSDPVVKLDSPLDTLSNYLAKRLALGPLERDIVILRHDIGVRWPDGRFERKGINLVCYGDVGDTGYSAMAKTVGYPTAIATKMVLNGEIQGKGNVLPFSPDIYRPMLARLRKEGIWPYDSPEDFEGAMRNDN